jgi:hypothetical protein
MKYLSQRRHGPFSISLYETKEPDGRGFHFLHCRVFENKKEIYRGSDYSPSPLLWENLRENMDLVFGGLIVLLVGGEDPVLPGKYEEEFYNWSYLLEEVKR